MGALLGSLTHTDVVEAVQIHSESSAHVELAAHAHKKSHHKKHKKAKKQHLAQ